MFNRSNGTPKVLLCGHVLLKCLVLLIPVKLGD